MADAVVFVQLVFREVAKPLTWRMGGGMRAANSIMPTAGSTGVSYWALSSVGWGAERFAERTAVRIIAPAALNFILIVIVGVLMGLGVVAGPSDWWLTWLPAAIAARRRARDRRRTLGPPACCQHQPQVAEDGLQVVSTGLTGTVDVLRSRNWRVLGTWVDLFGSIGALRACLIAVNDHVPFAVVSMGYLIGQLAQVIPVAGGIGTIDAGVPGASSSTAPPHHQHRRRTHLPRPRPPHPPDRRRHRPRPPPARNRTAAPPPDRGSGGSRCEPRQLKTPSR